MKKLIIQKTSNMKVKAIIISIVTSLLFVITINAQESYTDKKHEINLGFFNIFNLTESPGLGIGYKYHLKKGAIRLNSSFNISNTDYESNNYLSTISYNKYKIKTGYELHQNINKFQFFYGSDISYNAENEKTENSSDYFIEEKTKGYGVSPFVGLKFFINQRVSISSETNVSILFSESKQKITIINSSTQTIENSTSQTEIGLIPFGLITINFHL